MYKIAIFTVVWTLSLTFTVYSYSGNTLSILHPIIVNVLVTESEPSTITTTDRPHTLRNIYQNNHCIMTVIALFYDTVDQALQIRSHHIGISYDVNIFACQSVLIYLVKFQYTVYRSIL